MSGRAAGTGTGTGTTATSIQGTAPSRGGAAQVRDSEVSLTSWAVRGRAEFRWRAHAVFSNRRPSTGGCLSCRLAVAAVGAYDGYGCGVLWRAVLRMGRGVFAGVKIAREAKKGAVNNEGSKSVVGRNNNSSQAGTRGQRGKWRGDESTQGSLQRQQMVAAVARDQGGALTKMEWTLLG